VEKKVTVGFIIGPEECVDISYYSVSVSLNSHEHKIMQYHQIPSSNEGTELLKELFLCPGRIY
jgi:hypothetical protein